MNASSTAKPASGDGHAGAFHHAEGVARYHAGNLAGAAASFRLALNCDAAAVASEAMLAVTALRLGAANTALHHATRVLAKRPDDVDTLLAVIGAALRLSDFAMARKGLRALPDLRQLSAVRQVIGLAIAAETAEPEAMLFSIAQVLEQRPEDVMTRELFLKRFEEFASDADKARFDAFVDGLGLAPPEDGPPEIAAAFEAGSVDIIIPVFDAVDDLARCLASLARHDSALIGRIILVDDCSDAITQDWLARHAAGRPKMQIIRTVSNCGFTRSITAGVAASTAPYMVFLNSDTVVTLQWLEGLARAMAKNARTALAGPLSNNGFYQTIRAETGAVDLALVESDPDEAAALVRVESLRCTPRIPFLGGFCLMVRRAAFDRVGGLDCAAFPFGYWEVQDLSLKLHDIGMNAVIADDVYVHHAGGGSITSARKQALEDRGRRVMYDRHSALRVLVAEALSAADPEVRRHRHMYSRHAAYMRYRETSLTRPEPRRAALRERKCGVASFAGREVCLFVIHCPHGAALEYTMRYLQEFRDAGIAVIGCLANDDLDIPLAQDLLDLCDMVIVRENLGYDFGSWADALRLRPDIWQAARVYFVNDSLIGPFTSLEPIFTQIKDTDAGFFALSECTYTSYHAQSFFFGWNSSNLGSSALQAFWNAVENKGDKADVINCYEHAIQTLSPNLPDTRQQVVFGMRALLGCDPDVLACVNPTHNFWRHMLQSGFPFIKTDLLRDGVAPIDTTGWEAVAEAQGADVAMILRHIEGSRINRMKV